MKDTDISLSTTDEILIRAQGLSKKYCRNLSHSLRYGLMDILLETTFSKNAHRVLRPGEFWALKDLSFEIKRGEVVSFIGKNGAGKTSLLKLIDGLTKPDRGTLQVKGRIGALIALGTGFNPVLTGRENIFVNAAVLGIPKPIVQKKIEAIIAFAELEEAIDRPLGHYSTGMVVRLGFSVGVHLEPDILLIDEVLSVGDLSFNQKSLRKTQEMVAKKTSAIVFVSHKMFAISQISDRIIWLEGGRIKMQGEPNAVIEAFEAHMQNEPLDSRASLSERYQRKGLLNDKLALTITCLQRHAPGPLEQEGYLRPQDGLSLVLEFLSPLCFESLELKIHLQKEDGQYVWSYHHPETFRFEKNSKTQMQLTLPQLFLLSSTYYMSVEVYEGRTLKGALALEPFQVRSDSTRVLTSFAAFDPLLDSQIVDIETHKGKTTRTGL